MQRLATPPVPESFPKPLSNAPMDRSADSSAAALTWRVHLLREDPPKLAGILAAALLVVASAFAVFHNIVPGLVAALLLLVSLAEYLLPLTFTLDPRGAHVACGSVEWLSIEWKAVRSVYRTSYGIKLSPFADPKTARMEQCRGVRLRVPPARIAQVEQAISSFREECGQ